MFRFAASTLPVTLRRLGLVAMAGSVAALSACGGGDRAKAYQPDRVVSFGDENSAISSYTSSDFLDASTNPTTLKGLTYAVNSVTAETPVYCAQQSPAGTTCPADDATVSHSDFVATAVKGFVLDPAQPNTVTLIETGTATIGSTPSSAAQRTTVYGYFCNATTIWIQVIAHNFGKGYSTKCFLEPGGAETYATPGANVAGVAAQVNANLGTLGVGTLVTIMAGQNDILELFTQVQNGRSEGDATTELLGRASSLASVVRQVIGTGSKVVLALTPDLGESPRAYGFSVSDRAILKRMTTAFNNKLYITELGNSSGRQLAGVGTENYTDPNLRISGIDYTDQLCNFSAVAKPDGSAVSGSDPDRVKYCNSNTLVSTTTTYMWADDIHFSSYAHGQIGLAGANRAYNQF